MGDSLMTIIAIFVAAVLMFVVPLMAVAERNDDIAQAAVQTATSEFVDKIAISGQIKPSDYEAFQTTLAATGNMYEIEIEVQHLDENPGKKTTTTSSDLIGENLRYSSFTSEIIDETIYKDPDNPKAYTLKKGDNVIVTVKNTNTTLAQALRTGFYKIAGKDTTQLAGSASSMVVNSGK